ncbi:MAG: tetratricopeptide repeat protein, partial [Anaerolineae bacterium]|nr:tetratricopeptide repeat protein [Anaerolineae bacterium]
LTDLTPTAHALLAYHWTEAQDWIKAAEYHQQAGAHAQSVYANHEAAVHYTQALEALKRLSRPVDPVRAFTLHQARETVYALLGERSKQASDLDAMEKWLAHPTLDTPNRRIYVNLRRVAYYEAISDYSQAFDAVREAARQAAQAQDSQSEYQAHLRWGRLLQHSGDFEPAQQHLDQARALAQAMDDSTAQAVSLNELGALAFVRGEYGAALAFHRRALELAAQGSDRAVQASIHNNLGNVWHYLADYSAALTGYSQALSLLRAMGDRRGEARTLYNLACVYHDSGDREAARSTLEQVCDLTHAIGDRRIEGYGWVYLGLVLEYLGQFEAAQDAYRKGLALRREVGLHALAIDALAGLARVASAQGDHAEAVSHADEVLAWLEERGPDGVGDPCLAYQGAYRALLTAGQVERGEAALRAAYGLLMTYAGTISDPARRHAYLHDIEPGRTIWDDYHGLNDCRVTVRLPRTGAPLRRALRDDETVEVTWTVSSPADEKISNKASRRQHRLLRLLREAHDQGTAPSHQDLADALHVSLRTIERDVDALNRQGIGVPPTRGKMSA